MRWDKDHSPVTAEHDIAWHYRCISYPRWCVDSHECGVELPSGIVEVMRRMIGAKERSEGTNLLETVDVSHGPVVDYAIARLGEDRVP